jgi:RNA polymerase sigma-70 factor (ECF subfamily)
MNMDDAPSLSDGELVGRVLAGDVERFGELVERYRLEFGRLARSLVGDPDAADDALQDAFISAYRNLARCRDPERFRVWFYRIVANRCHDARRRRPTVPLEDVDPQAPERTDARLDSSELKRRLERAMEVLTEEQREVFVMKEVEGKSYQEMEMLLGITIDALRMRVHRAREALRQQLGDLQ